MKKSILKAMMLSIMTMILSITFISTSYAKEDVWRRSVMCVFPNDKTLSFEDVTEFNRGDYGMKFAIILDNGKTSVIRISPGTSCISANVLTKSSLEVVMEPNLLDKQITIEDIFDRYTVE